MVNDPSYVLMSKPKMPQPLRYTSPLSDDRSEFSPSCRWLTHLTASHAFEIMVVIMKKIESTYIKKYAHN